MARDSFKFEDNSKQAKEQLGKASEEGLLAALLVVEGRAKALARVDSGELRDKIDHRITFKGNVKVGQVGSPNIHAFYVEFGTGEFAENGAGRKGGWVYKHPDGRWMFTYGMKPKPFLRPAFRGSRKEIESLIGTKLKSSFRGK